MKCRLCNKPTIKAFETHNIHGREIIDNSTYQLFFCQNCQSYSLEMVERNPKYYSQAYNTKYYPSTSLPTRILNFISFSIRRIIIQLNVLNSKQKINILDIGCGQGEFLSFLSDDHFTLNGSEINPQAIKLAQQKNIKVFSGNINTIDFKSQKFDCITLWHVLEHLSDPQQTLNKAFNLLKSGGIIMATVPCSQSLGFSLGKKNCFHLDSPRHLFIPSKTGLKHIFSQAGFKNINTSNPFYDYPLDLFWSIRKSIYRFIIYPLYPLFKLFSTESIFILATKKEIIS